MKKIALAVLVGSILFFSQSSWSSWLGGEGNDRCGIGTKIWGDGKSVSSQSSEESTNNSFSDTFSITTGTSGCSNSGFVKATQDELLYANINFEELLVEMSQGRGEVLAGFAQTLGCNANAVPTLLQVSKKEYPKMIGNSPEEILLHFKQTLQTHPVLSANCQSITG